MRQKYFGTYSVMTTIYIYLSSTGYLILTNYLKLVNVEFKLDFLHKKDLERPQITVVFKPKIYFIK